VSNLRIRFELTSEQIKRFHEVCGKWLDKQRKERSREARKIARSALDAARRNDDTDPDLPSM